MRFSSNFMSCLQLCGATVFGLGIYMNATNKYLSIFPSISVINLASALFVIGIFVTCVSFLGFLGALKENRCLLISVSRKRLKRASCHKGKVRAKDEKDGRISTLLSLRNISVSLVLRSYFLLLLLLSFLLPQQQCCTCKKC